MTALDTTMRGARRRPIAVPNGTTQSVELGTDAIERMLPHRAPMLLVDRISAVDLDGAALWAHRRIDPGDAVLAGHFPGDPVYPGALLLEAIGQASLCLHHLLEAGRATVLADDRPQPVRLLKVHEATFLAECRPGEELTLVCRRIAYDGYTATCVGQAVAGDSIRATAALEVFLVDEPAADEEEPCA